MVRIERRGDGKLLPLRSAWLLIERVILFNSAQLHMSIGDDFSSLRIAIASGATAFVTQSACGEGFEGLDGGGS